jgi:hypothetical protein
MSRNRVFFPVSCASCVGKLLFKRYGIHCSCHISDECEVLGECEIGCDEIPEHEDV